ncbi:hypothetical protein [Solidesulfovibrio aerotolerans]|uniref:hypothetical protein n=1 Tax=Solidesulfovibrio aerotolerans TaxID=295255 RepID=UPI001FE48573|nr:hypothetical protein [Solidesulfovibrio aerotolerans]
MVDLSAILARITGVPHTFDGPYFVCAEPGGEPHLARWDEAVLGERPTGEQMAAVGLALAQAGTCTAIDDRAEALRSVVLTPGSGQMAAYQEKERQARALLQDATPTEGEYPDIFNEIGITAASAGEVAMAVVAAAEKWRTFGRLVERARLAGKKAVSEATDPTGVLAARDGIVWPQCGNPSLSSAAK